MLARNEYLTAENRILKAQLNGRLERSDAERSTLGEIGHRLGRTALAEVATVAKPDTILAWYRKLVVHKFDGSNARRGPGRPRVTRKVEQLMVRLAEENRDWGYDRIAGGVANLGYRVCHQTVGNVLQRQGLPPAPERKRTTTWSAFRSRRTGQAPVLASPNQLSTLQKQVACARLSRHRLPGSSSRLFCNVHHRRF
jgi:putative transposase